MFSSTHLAYSKRRNQHKSSITLIMLKRKGHCGIIDATFSLIGWVPSVENIVYVDYNAHRLLSTSMLWPLELCVKTKDRLYL